MTPPASEFNITTLSGTLDAGIPVTELRLPNGQMVRLDTYLLLGAQSSLMQSDLQPSSDRVKDGETQVIPIIEERLLVGKQTVKTAKVRLIKTVSEYTEQLNEPLAVRTFDIERIVVNKVVDTAPAVRQEGNVTVYPVVEEELVLTKRLVLKEEIHVTLRDTTLMDTQPVTLHREHLTVEREDLTGGASKP